MLETWLPIVGGLALLVVGGELLVRGSVAAASRLGVSPLVIGLTLVGFGTSAPELVTSVQAALSGSPGIAYGNVVGSNLANILLILGLAAVVTPIAVQSPALKRDGTVMIGATIAFAVIAALTPMGRVVGTIFLLALAGYIIIAFRQERASTGDHGAAFDRSLATQRADPALAPTPAKARGPLATALLTALLGLAVVVGGGYLLVDGAVSLARSLGVSETVIGLTIVAVGTSMPELVTSVVAAIRRQTDVAFGNIIGSNIYNILGIAGVTAVMAPSTVPDQLVRSDNPIMVAVSLLVLVFAWTSMKLSRREGAVLLLGYAGYIAWMWP